jgi:hypothetical protein
MEELFMYQGSNHLLLTIDRVIDTLQSCKDAVVKGMPVKATLRLAEKELQYAIKQASNRRRTESDQAVGESSASNGDGEADSACSGLDITCSEPTSSG